MTREERLAYMREYNRKYRRTHAYKIKEYQREWHRRHKEQDKEYYEKNKDRIKAYCREYYKDYKWKWDDFYRPRQVKKGAKECMTT